MTVLAIMRTPHRHFLRIRPLILQQFVIPPIILEKCNFEVSFLFSNYAVTLHIKRENFNLFGQKKRHDIL